jgi:hypothetical protein
VVEPTCYLNLLRRIVAPGFTLPEAGLLIDAMKSASM